MAVALQSEALCYVGRFDHRIRELCRNCLTYHQQTFFTTIIASYASATVEGRQMRVVSSNTAIMEIGK